MKRKRGAQPGNRNAVKHGFYCKTLTREDTSALKEAHSIKGIDVEIAAIRLKICHILERDPYNFDLFIRASGMLARLLRLKNELYPGQSKGLRQLGDVPREIGSLF